MMEQDEARDSRHMLVQYGRTEKGTTQSREDRNRSCNDKLFVCIYVYDRNVSTGTGC